MGRRDFFDPLLKFSNAPAQCRDQSGQQLCRHHTGLYHRRIVSCRNGLTDLFQTLLDALSTPAVVLVKEITQRVGASSLQLLQRGPTQK
jgi:hypothetical protein